MTDIRRFAWLVVACLAIAACTNSPAAGGPSPSNTPRPTASPSPTPTPEPTPTPTPTLPDDALLPNLVMEPLDEWQVEYRDGRRLLRMTTIFSNYGDGPFELRGSRSSTEAQEMLLDQVVYLESGGFRRVPTGANARYAGDDHDHWHAQQVVTLELSPVLDPASVRNGEKVHFCFFDNVPTNRDIDEFNTTGFYERRWCGTPNSFAVRMGLSLGWGDRYGWDFAFQWIDITGMAGGSYTLRATVDYADAFLETDDTDNCTISQISIPVAGEGQIVTVEADDQPCPT